MWRVTHWWVVLLSVENTCRLHTSLPTPWQVSFVPHRRVSHHIPICRREDMRRQKPCDNGQRHGKVSLCKKGLVFVTFNNIIFQEPEFAPVTETWQQRSLLKYWKGHMRKESLLMKEKRWWSSEAHLKALIQFRAIKFVFPLTEHSILTEPAIAELMEKNEFIFVKFHTGLARDTPSDHPQKHWVSWCWNITGLSHITAVSQGAELTSGVVSHSEQEIRTLKFVPRFQPVGDVRAPL